MNNFLLNYTPILYWTQSLWRDEAFSVWISDGTIPEIINKTSGDFNPPLYYILLNFWGKIFGTSEIALRGLSVLFFLCFLIIIYLFAKKIWKSDYWASYTTILSAINPMLLYFAFELRMYSLLVLLTTLSMYFLYSQKWLWYIVATTLGLYTQPFMFMILISQNIYLMFKKSFRQIVTNNLILFILYIPWIPVLLSQFKNSGPMWMWPVDLNLILSVLGNLYFGYEGTPTNLWPFMQFMSLLIIIAALVLWKKSRQKDFPRLLLTWIFVPLIIVLGISVFKPIYVHRYVIYVTIAEVLLITAFLKNLRNFQSKIISKIILALTFIISFFIIPSFHQKVDFQTTFKKVNARLSLSDVIYAETPLVFFESWYYRPKNIPVYLYNPEQITPPRYTGSGGMQKNLWKTTFPKFPGRAFVISENGQYRIESEIE